LTALVDGTAPVAEAAADVDPRAARIEELEAERQTLLSMLTQTQRVSQAGLITSALAHDVSNHAQAVSGACYLALASGCPERWRLALEKIQRQCVTLTETTTAFLGFVRRRDHDADPAERFRVSRVVDESCRLLAPLARVQAVSLLHEVAGDAWIAGNRRHAVQALVNVATNALRACGGGRGGRVDVRAGAATPRTCRIEVRDNGPGIPDAVRWRLFRPFSTGHGTAGGNGLGLFIVRRLVRELGGRIRVVSSAAGTTFTIELPVAA